MMNTKNLIVSAVILPCNEYYCKHLTFFRENKKCKSPKCKSMLFNDFSLAILKKIL